MCKALSFIVKLLNVLIFFIGPSLSQMAQRPSIKCIPNRAVEMFFKPTFLGFYKKLKASKVQILVFLVFVRSFRKHFKNPDLRLTVTAENNCCLSV